MKRFVAVNLFLIIILSLSIQAMTIAGAGTDGEGYRETLDETREMLPITNAKAETKAETKTETEVETGAEAEAKTEAETKAETEAETEAKTNILARAVAQMKAEGKIAGYSPDQANRWNIRLSPEEEDLVDRITMLEAGGESDKGQQAVAEVIMNRVYSKEFPDTVYEVLSQETNGCSQFVTWKNRNKKEAAPTERVKKNVRAVLNGETNILPFKTLYFSKKPENKHVQCVIGHHVFCNQP